jgi:DNA-directed RNA polymerase specialized sigma24 family protein
MKATLSSRTQLYSDVFPSVGASLYTMIGKTEDAIQLAQELFIDLFRKYDEIENHRKWLLGAMRHKLFEYYSSHRHGRSNRARSSRNLSLTYANGFRDTRIIIEDIIEQSGFFQNSREKYIFDYIAYQNFSYTHVGRIFGISQKKAGNIYSRICHRLLKELEKKGIHNIEELL